MSSLLDAAVSASRAFLRVLLVFLALWASASVVYLLLYAAFIPTASVERQLYFDYGSAPSLAFPAPSALTRLSAGPSVDTRGSGADRSLPVAQAELLREGGPWYATDLNPRPQPRDRCEIVPCRRHPGPP